MQLVTASLTDQGGRPRNEDSFGDWSSERLYCCVVADGAGGHGGGDTASRIVVDSVLADLRYLTVTELPPTGERLVSALAHANENIVEEQSRGSGDETDMRSTAVVLAIDRECRTAAWAHCGDTRLYCFRQGQIHAQTRDHSMVQEMVDARLLLAEEIRHHPRRNVLYAALGTEDQLDIAGSDGTFALLEGDAFLICTDGLWEYDEETFVRDALASAGTPAAWLDALAARVRATARANHDNYTAVAVWVRGDDLETTVLKPTPRSALV
ncbi:PP2C family protein-serine/threonine phosphatase [Paraburkholderia kirstenboschensis]|uniref:Protein phosphatase 2C domain-containing protein n=1 Tax=Paraburkholderia kirstenboschensis TaxID=1245436 RepID=A0ABZ0EUY1_9BURK|nr:protein phosphatase 2C domain-containing protein [Paraburkholderia kirstenboschensis]WOD20092.1 protein phosphatase 2C domain-containing protein [Paraburkholderia kirstenboschensis]